MADPYYQIPVIKDGETQLPFKFRWGGAEDSEGLALDIHFEANPEFCEVYFEEDLSLMMELNGRWFYKAPGTKCVDLMEAFFDKPLSGPTDLDLKFFATPSEGVNTDDGRDDWDVNYYAAMTKMPTLRIRYEPVSIVP